MLAYLRHLFTSPSAYLHSWRGFLANQLGHAAIGLVLAHTLLGWWTLAFYAVWEIAQYRYSRGKSLWRHNGPMRVGALPSDCVEDFTYVSSGVLAVLVHPAFLIITALMLTSGVLVRRGN